MGNGPSAASTIATALIEIASQRGSELAISDRRHRWDFDELDARVGAVAAEIAERHAEGDQWLPVIVDRSVHSVVAIHAAMRAGVPFALVESTSPAEVVRTTLRRLGDPSLTLDATGSFSQPGTNVTDVTTPGRREPIGPRHVALGDRALAIFTSGSTGRPKGVVHSWATLDFHFSTRQRRVEDRSSTYESAPAPFSFLAGLAQAMNPAAGRSIGIIDPTRLSLDELLETLDHEGFDTIVILPSQAVALSRRSGPHRRLDRVRVVRTYGEPLRWEQVPTIRRLAGPGVLIENNYAASEAPGAVLYLTIAADEPLGAGRVPLGRPFTPERIRLLPVDGDDQLLELAVTGSFALRYLDDPVLDAERFLVDADGRRCWRTGDLVRVDEQGLFHHLGRRDDLIKINGKLVEPSESEEALRSMPEISEAVVLPQIKHDGAPRLVAHVVVSPDHAQLDPTTVRTRLETRLARHVIPALLVRHDRLPVGERGKIDRRALTTAEPVPWRATPPRPPVGEYEPFLTTTLARILDLPEVAPDDDIWYLGLDSMGAAELSAAVGAAGLGELALDRLIIDRTPARIATKLRRPVPDRRAELVMMNPDGQRTPIIAIPGGGQTALSFHGLSTALGPDQPIAVVEAQGLHLPGQPHRRVEAAADHAHRLLEQAGLLMRDRTITVLGHSAGGTIGYELCQRLVSAGHDVELVLIDATPGGPPDRTPTTTSAAPSHSAQRASSLIERASAKFRGRSLSDIISLARVRGAGMRFTIRPGPPSTRSERYHGFGLIAIRAPRRYRPEPARFQAVLFAVDDSTAPQRCRRWIERLEVHPIGGEHRQAIELPHVSVVAERLLGGAVSFPGSNPSRPDEDPPSGSASTHHARSGTRIRP